MPAIADRIMVYIPVGEVLVNCLPPQKLIFRGHSRNTFSVKLRRTTSLHQRLHF